MPQFIFNLLKDSQVRDPSILNRLVSDIKNALDVVRTNNFAAGIIPHTSLAKDVTFVPMILRYSGTVTGAFAAFIDVANIPKIEAAGEGMELISIWGTCGDITGPNDVVLRIYRDPGGGAVLLDTLTLSAADDPPQKDNATLAAPVTFLENDLIMLFATVAAGTSVDEPTVVALFKVPHATS